MSKGKRKKRSRRASIAQNREGHVSPGLVQNGEASDQIPAQGVFMKRAVDNSNTRPRKKKKKSKNEHGSYPVSSNEAPNQTQSKPSLKKGKGKKIKGKGSKKKRAKTGDMEVGSASPVQGPEAGAGTGVEEGVEDDEEGEMLDGHELLSALYGTEEQRNPEVDVEHVFAWLLAPLPVQDFYQHYADKKPVCINRGGAGEDGQHAYSGWWGIQEVRAALRDPSQNMLYGRDLDVTTYQDGQRRTLNPAGRAGEAQVMKFFEEGASVRFLHPQTYSTSLWKLLAALDEFWGCNAGINTYLTPAHTQGFAPHYDEVDIFVMQTEGSKRWRLYHPRNNSEILPEFSSRNFGQHEIGKPFLDVLLKPGDFLYAPRGTIHQCVASDQHSMHITISGQLLNNVGRFLAFALPRALNLAFQENLNFRAAMPRDYFSYMGALHSEVPAEEEEEEDEEKDEEEDEEEEEEGKAARKGGRQPTDPRRTDFFQSMSGHMQDLLQYVPWDAAADRLALDFMHGRVPLPMVPVPLPKLSTEALVAQCGVRLLRPGVARMVVESLAADEPGVEPETAAYLYHIMDNDRLFKQNPLACLRYPMACCEALDMLLTSFPAFLPLQDLPLAEPLCPATAQSTASGPADPPNLFLTSNYTQSKTASKGTGEGPAKGGDSEGKGGEGDKGELVEGCQNLPLSVLGKDFLFRRRVTPGLLPEHFPNKPKQKKREKHSRPRENEEGEFSLAESVAALVASLQKRNLVEVRPLL